MLVKCQRSRPCFDNLNKFLQEYNFLFRKIKGKGTKIIKCEIQKQNCMWTSPIGNKWIHPANGEGGNLIEIFGKKR